MPAYFSQVLYRSRQGYLYSCVQCMYTSFNACDCDQSNSFPASECCCAGTISTYMGRGEGEDKKMGNTTDNYSTLSQKSMGYWSMEAKPFAIRNPSFPEASASGTIIKKANGLKIQMEMIEESFKSYPIKIQAPQGAQQGGRVRIKIKKMRCRLRMSMAQSLGEAVDSWL